MTEEGSGRAPKRIQRKRTRGWRMPKGAVYVGRRTIWGNHWKVGLVTNCMCDKDEHEFAECPHNFLRRATAQECVSSYREWMLSSDYRIGKIKAELRGKDLACWCPLDQPCHADVLLEIANG